MKIIVALLIILSISILVELIRFRQEIKFAVIDAESAIPYEQSGSGQTILVAGDSTLLGTGASTPDASVIGLIGAALPDAEINNISVNGHKWEDMTEAIKGVKKDYGITVIGSGGNDLIRARSFNSIRKNFTETLELATSRSDIVIVITHGNIGASRLFPYFLRPILKYRSRVVSSIYSEICSKYGNVYHVSMYLPPSEDPYVQSPSTYFAEDKLHPSDAGYKVWFDRLKGRVPDLF